MTDLEKARRHLAASKAKLEHPNFANAPATQRNKMNVKILRVPVAYWNRIALMARNWSDVAAMLDLPSEVTAYEYCFEGASLERVVMVKITHPAFPEVPAGRPIPVVPWKPQRRWHGLEDLEQLTAEAERKITEYCNRPFVEPKPETWRDRPPLL